MICIHQFPNNCTLYPEQSFFLFKTSFLFSFASIYGIYKMQYDLSLVGFGLFLTSINYWKNPISNSWQKKLDVNYVRFALLYYFYRSLYSEYFITYNTITLSTILFYPLSNYLYNKKLYWYSTYVHSILHLGTSCAGIILFSGYIPKIV